MVRSGAFLTILMFLSLLLNLEEFSLLMLWLIHGILLEGGISNERETCNAGIVEGGGGYRCCFDGQHG